jgi:serine/threonine-protein kinase
MVAALDHPSIIPIYDAGEENGIVYIAMRHVSGGDLRELIAWDRPRAGRRVDPRAGGGRSTLRARNPSIGTSSRQRALDDGSSDRVYLTDFGIVSDPARAAHPDRILRGTRLRGPEQILRASRSGPRPDVYAFGCSSTSA